MSYNNKIIIGLANSIIIIGMLVVLNSLYLKSKIIDSFAISYISGATVSSFMTYVQYKKEKSDTIYYFNNIIVDYYELLNNMMSLLNDDQVKNKQKYDVANKYLDNYLANNKATAHTIQLNLIKKDIEEKYTKKIYEELYVFTKGKVLLDFFNKMADSQIDKLKEICDFQINKIDEGMTILTGFFSIDYPWNEFKKSIGSDVNGLDYFFFGKKR